MCFGFVCLVGCELIEVGLVLYCDRVVEQTGARLFGIDDAELMKRRRYVKDMRRTLSVSARSPYAYRCPYPFDSDAFCLFFIT